MAAEQVRLWRADPADRTLLMAGHTDRYGIEPRGEYVFGVVAGAPMLASSGGTRRLVPPGRLVAWDPSRGHSGVAVGGRPWQSRLIVVESGDLAALACDRESDQLADVVFPYPVVPDADLVRAFLAMHTALEGPNFLLTELFPALRRIDGFLGADVRRPAER